MDEASVSHLYPIQESLMGLTQVIDCEELEVAPVKAPLVSVPKSNFRILSKDEEEGKRSRSVEEINLSDKEK